MIRLRNVVRAFGPTRVLAGVTLDLARGDLVVVTGGAGSGKSTLLQTMAALLPVDGGTIEVEGRRVLADGWLAPGDELSAGEYFNFALGRRRSDAGAAALERADLQPSTPVRALTSAERLRLSIACALAAKADVVLLDGEVDACFAPWIADVGEAGTTVVIACRERDAAFAQARTLRLADGKLGPAYSAPAPQLVGAPA